MTSLNCNGSNKWDLRCEEVCLFYFKEHIRIITKNYKLFSVKIIKFLKKFLKILHPNNNIEPVPYLLYLFNTTFHNMSFSSLKGKWSTVALFISLFLSLTCRHLPNKPICTITYPATPTRMNTRYPATKHQTTITSIHPSIGHSSSAAINYIKNSNLLKFKT